MHGGNSFIRRQLCLSEPSLLSHLLKKKTSTSMTQWFVLILVSEAGFPALFSALSAVIIRFLSVRKGDDLKVEKTPLEI